MALEKERAIDKIEILEGGHIQVRRAIWLVEDGQRTRIIDYERVAYPPGHDLSKEDSRVQAIAKADSDERAKNAGPRGLTRPKDLGGPNDPPTQ